MCKKINKTHPKKILVIRTDRIGDVVLSLPVIDNLRAAFPEAHLAFMCAPQTEDIVKSYPGLHEIVVYDKGREHRSFAATLRFVNALRRKRFDWALLLHSTNRVDWVAFLAGIPLRIGWDRKQGWLLTKRLPYQQKRGGNEHERDYNLRVLTALDVPVRSTDVRVYPDAAALKQMRDVLRRHRIQPGEMIIGMHPESSCPSKRWPLRSFEELAQRLIQSHNARVIVIAGKKIPFVIPAAAASDRLLNLSGQLRLSELIALSTFFTLLVSNDSGPVHIAAGVGVPCVVMFGRNEAGLSPRRWGPLGAGHRVLHKQIGCQRCDAHACTKGFLCLRSITVDEVFQAVREVLERVPKI